VPTIDKKVVEGYFMRFSCAASTCEKQCSVSLEFTGKLMVARALDVMGQVQKYQGLGVQQCHHLAGI
jgi:hypothetical protein